MNHAHYEYLFECPEFEDGRTMQACEWKHVEDDGGVRIYQVRALDPCPYCGVEHVEQTIAPRPIEGSRED